MKRVYLLLSLLTICLSPAWGQVQKTMQEQLWEGLEKSLLQDVSLKEENAKRIEEERKNKIYLDGVEELKSVLSNPYSKSRVRRAKDLIGQLRTTLQLTQERMEELSMYEQLASGYEKQVGEFLAIFNGKITHPDYERYKKEIDTLTPPKLQTLAGILKEHYENNGLNSLIIPERYVYLNAKLEELRNDLKSVDDISDSETLLNRLESIVKIESEISEEHKTYHALK